VGAAMALLPTTSWFLTCFLHDGILLPECAANALELLCARAITPLQFAFSIVLGAAPELRVAEDVHAVVRALQERAVSSNVVQVALACQLPSESELAAMRREERATLLEASRGMAARTELVEVQHSTHFDFELVEKLQYRFRELCSGGGGEEEQEEPSIDLPAFRSVLRAAAPDNAALDDDALTAQIFEVADVSGDGRLQFRELASMLSIICRGNQPERAALVFRCYDTDGSGTIDRAELADALRTVYTVQAGSAPSAEAIAEQVQTIFAHFDMDGDGELNEEEFMHAVALDHRLLACFGTETNASTSTTSPTTTSPTTRQRAERRAASSSSVTIRDDRSASASGGEASRRPLARALTLGALPLARRSRGATSATHRSAASSQPSLARRMWVRDDDAKECANAQCALPFTLIRRRHHCRACGKIFCDACTAERRPMPPAFGYGSQPQRCCATCALGRMAS
jgi:Ca2+-binding EF-hand superfamily protein